MALPSNNSLMERIETTILRNLIFSEEYSRKVIPFIQPSYFEQRTEKIIFEEITKFIVKYGSSITIEALNIEAENRTDLTDEEIKQVRDINSSLQSSLNVSAEDLQEKIENLIQENKQLKLDHKRVSLNL